MNKNAEGRWKVEMPKLNWKCGLRGMRLHSYVVARDYGFAPNPFFGVCTLATCKPRIRAVAQLGDWIVGTGSKEHGREKHLVYAMCVTEAMTFEEYWADPRFHAKKPNLRGSKKQAFGDNIYHRHPDTDLWCQADSHHSRSDGSPNESNVVADTATNRVLLSDNFIYWGGSGPQLPTRFLTYGPGQISLCAGRNHKNNLPAELVSGFVAWMIRSFDEHGYAGEPLDWCRTP